MKSKDKAVPYGLPDNAVDARPPRKRWPHVLVMLLIFVVAGQMLTQEMARMAQFHPRLGAAVVAHYYYPWAWIGWRGLFADPGIFDAIFYQYTAITGLVFGGYALGVYYLYRPEGDQHAALHGSARFASFPEIQGMGLLEQSEGEADWQLASTGVVVGGYQHGKGRNATNLILRQDGPEHVLVIAPTGAGKGVCIVVPTLLTYPESVVVYDLKGENYALTGRWRKEHAGNVVLKFEPTCTDGTAASFNPLSEIRLFTDHDVQDCQNIAAIIMERGEETRKDGYFETAAYSLLVGYLLHIGYLVHSQGGQATLTDVSESLNDPDVNIEQLFSVMRDFRHKEGKPHPVCAREATGVLHMLETGAGKQFMGVHGMIVSKLALYADPIVRKNITQSDFRVTDLMHHDRPVSLYICVGATDKTRLSPLTKMLFSQIIRTLTKEVEFDHGEAAASYRHKLLLLIDEFPSLGRMPIMNESIAYLRGYGIRCMLIIQDFNQLRAANAYGREEAIVANSGVRIVFAPNSTTTAEEISKMLGTTTVTKQEVSISTNKKLFGSAGGNVSKREVSRSLMTADEIMRLQPTTKRGKRWHPGDMVVFVVGHRPIFGHQIPHFLDEVLLKRSQLGSLDQSDAISHPAAG